MSNTAARRLRALLNALLLAAGLAACAASQERARRAPADLAIQHVNVVDVKRGVVLRDRTILISGGRIERITVDARRAPAAAATIDGGGGFLIPGLWDMHAHLRGNGMPARISTEWMMPLLIAHGVTGVRDMNSDCDGPAQGPVCLAQMREWRAQIQDGLLTGPRLLALSSWPVDPPWTYKVTEAQARQVVRRFKEQDLDFIKIYDRLSPEAFGWVMDEAKAVDLRAGGHIPLRVTVTAASNAGLRSLEHARDFLFDCFPGSAEFRRTSQTSSPPAAMMRAMVDGHDPAACTAVFGAMVRNGTWYVPTHVTRRMEAFAADPAFRSDARIRYVPPAIMQDWVRDADRVAGLHAAAGTKNFLDFYRKGLELTGAAHRAGVRILAGTDGGDSFVFPGSSVHDELGELVSAGLTPADALRAATWNGAEFLGLTESHGSVDAGKHADLVLLDADPLQNITKTRKIRAVIFRGQLLDRARLDAFLRQAESAAGRSSGPGGPR